MKSAGNVKAGDIIVWKSGNNIANSVVIKVELDRFALSEVIEIKNYGEKRSGFLNKEKTKISIKTLKTTKD
jgi:hypothetical protein